MGTICILHREKQKPNESFFRNQSYKIIQLLISIQELVAFIIATCFGNTFLNDLLAQFHQLIPSFRSNKCDKAVHLRSVFGFGVMERTAATPSTIQTTDFGAVADLDKNLSGFLYGRGPIFFWQRPWLLSKIGRRPYSLFDKIHNCKIQY